MIRIGNLTKRFGRTVAVGGVTLEVARGDSVALWGSNGAGKTTLIRCIAGLYRYAGQITIGGRDAQRDGKRARALVGYVPQEIGFNDDQRVDSAIRFFGSIKGVSIRDTDAILQPVQLAGHGRKRMRELSGGMKQRLALALSLIGNPPVLLLDEVTASLDVGGRRELVSQLSALARSHDRAVVFASHRVDEIAALATRVAILDKGHLIEVLPVQAFAQRYRAETLLHLSIEVPLRERAIELLQQTGIGARLNGRGILVPVAQGQRMRPIELLTQHRIPIDDLDLTSSADHGSHS
jgi:ABC-type multidrug transport system ATPase subunit